MTTPHMTIEIRRGDDVTAVDLNVSEADLALTTAEFYLKVGQPAISMLLKNYTKKRLADG